MFGTEYKWIEPAVLRHWDVAARGGYLYSPTPVPSRTFDPAVPDGNSHILTAGVGFLCKAGGKFLGLVRCGEQSLSSAMGLDLAYLAIFNEVRHIAGNVPPLTAPAVVNGTYTTTQHAGLLTLRVNF